MINPEILQHAASIVPYDKKGPPVNIIMETMGSQSRLQGLSHWHDELECLYMLSGSMDFYIDEKEITLSPGDFFMLSSGVMHRSLSHGGEDCRFTRLLIHPSLLTASPLVREELLIPMLGDSARPGYLVPAANPHAPELAGLLRDMYVLDRDRPGGFELECIGILHILLARLYALFPPETRPKKEIAGPDLSSQRAMIALVQKYYPEKLTLDDIAKAGQVSKSKCCRIFKTYVQQTPIDFLNNYRLEIASNLLSTTDNPILEIANSCGFSSQSYFTKLFQEKFKTTPTAYRKSQR